MMGAMLFCPFFLLVLYGSFILWDSGMAGKIYKFAVYKYKQFMVK